MSVVNGKLIFALGITFLLVRPVKKSEETSSTVASSQNKRYFSPLDFSSCPEDVEIGIGKEEFTHIRQDL